MTSLTAAVEIFSFILLGSQKVYWGAASWCNFGVKSTVHFIILRVSAVNWKSDCIIILGVVFHYIQLPELCEQQWKQWHTASTTVSITITRQHLFTIVWIGTWLAGFKKLQGKNICFDLGGWTIATFSKRTIPSHIRGNIFGFTFNIWIFCLSQIFLQKCSFGFGTFGLA